MLSKHIRIGNIIKVIIKEIVYFTDLKVKKDEYFPCDMVMIGSSNTKGKCFIETKKLDGETDKKIKFIPLKVQSLLKT